MDKVRLGGMALQNGVLVHGPTSWAAAARREDGSVAVASGVKRRFLPRIDLPVARGALRLAESFALLPDVRRALPEARFAFERPAVAVAVLSGSVLAAAGRKAPIGAFAREALVAMASLAPAAIALRGGELAGYHGAEHVSIGTYEQDGRQAKKEHERCGSHLVGPLLATSAVAGAVAARAPKPLRGVARLAGTVGAVGTSIELFHWMGKHPESRIAKALARPGHELQARLSTEDPSPEQLEVANAALQACLEAELAATR